jgi:hypothetical protein
VVNRILALRGERDVGLAAIRIGGLMHGDIPVGDWRLIHEGVLPSYGLHEFVGRAATDGWQKVLRGELLPLVVPKESRQTRNYAVPPVRVIVDGVPLPSPNCLTQGPSY